MLTRYREVQLASLAPILVDRPRLDDPASGFKVRLTSSPSINEGDSPAATNALIAEH